MAATFLKARGHEVGKSLVEEERLETASGLMQQAAESGVTVVLPEDVLIAAEISPEAEAAVVSVDDIPAEQKIVDIGPQTIEIFKSRLRSAKTVFWNGPPGIEEIPQFARGTEAMAQTLAEIDAKTILGGGSTAEAVHNMGLEDKMTFVSTGGGASLEFLGGENLPGVESLMERERGGI